MHTDIKLFRKRFIPMEFQYLEHDVVLYADDACIFAAWKKDPPRKDAAAGISGYFFKEGFKINRIYDMEGNFSYWYCDIGVFDFHREKGECIFTDLLIDVVVSPDGFVRVLDLDELSDSYLKNEITKEQLDIALKTANRLLSIIYSGSFSDFTGLFERFSLPE